MATTLNKVITRNVDNTITTSTNYSELNVKASNLANDLVTHLQAQVTAMEGALQTKEGAVDVKIASLASVGTSTYTTPYLDRSLTMLSKAEFNAVANLGKQVNAGSGFIEFGRHIGTALVNEGLYCDVSFSNYFRIGRQLSDGLGTSRTADPIFNINGNIGKLSYCNATSSAISAQVILPPAPTVLPSTATLTQQQIDSGVIKHADASNSGLIVNGKFDTVTSGWTATTSTLSVVVNELRVTLTSTIGYASQSFATVIGKKYTVEYSHTAGTSAGVAYVKIGTSAGTSTNATSTSVVGRNVVEFTATATTTYISLEVNGVSGEYDDFDNIAVLPADAISRSDLAFLESWHEDISEKGVVYRYGNTQFKGASESAFGTQVTPSAGTPVFAGYGTYSLFSDTWQADEALIGNCYIWANMTDAQKKAFVADHENNCYLDGDKVIQVRYRMRVVQGLGDSWINVDTNLPYSSPYYSALLGNASSGVSPKGKLVNTNDFGTYVANGTFIGKYHPTAIGYGVDGMFSASGANGTLGLLNSYDNKCFALPITLVHRRNQGMMHPVYNPNGTKLASDSLPWYSTTISFTSIADCFTESKLLATSGYIGTTTGRADGIFYDQVHEGDITDLRMSSKVPTDYNRLIDKEFNRLVAGTYRGTEGEWVTETTYSTSPYLIYDYGTTEIAISLKNTNSLPSLLVGDTIQVSYYNGTTITSDRAIVTIVSQVGYFRALCPNISAITTTGNNVGDGIKYVTYQQKSTRTKSNTLTHTDTIGSPANYPTTWKQSVVSGTPLIVAEDGTSLLPTGTTGSDGLAIYKLSRKANATPLQVLKSTDSGVTWTALTVTTNYAFSTTTNAITFTAGNIPLTTDLIRVTYQTHTNMAVSAVNSEVLAIGGVYASQHMYYTLQSLIGKSSVFVNSAAKFYDKRINFIDKPAINAATGMIPPAGNYGYSPSHDQIVLYDATTPTVKVFPYLTRSNGKAWLNIVFKEMKYGSYAAPIVVTAASATYTINMTYKINIAGCALDGKVIQWIAATATVAVDWSLYDVSPTGVIYLLSSGAVYANARLYDGDSWGDDSKFNIVDNVSTTTDTNGATVLIGQKRIELPYFISASE